jgi:hypothetical protein
MIAALLVVASTSVAFGYTGATVTAHENDNAVLNATVFPVPAAAGMAGAQLLYDNSAQLSFSSGYLNASDRNWLTMPLSSAGVTINNVSGTGSSPAAIAGVNNNLGITDGQYYTNTQDAAANAKFPSNIPRPGRDCDAAFSSFQFALTQAAPEFGVFVARNSNAWTYIDDWSTPTRNGQWLGDAGMPYPDDNNVKFTNTVFVAVLGATDTFETAQYVQLDLINQYAPFIKVASNGTDLIKSVCVFQDAGFQGAPTFGFFDVYATPEPISLLLVSIGLLGISRRRSNT